jgi:osmotically-inducible protein OsmY
MKPMWMLGLAGTLLGVSGCTSAERAGVRQDVKGVRQQLRGAAEDAKIAAGNAAAEAKVKAALESRKGLVAKGINVEMNSGHLVLKGDVASREQAELAEKVALETDGVNSVDNQLMLRVPAKSEPAPTPHLGGP